MIQELSLDNFLAFRRANVRLGPLTLLTGTNSAGKSSVLHSLALLRQSFDSDALPSLLVLNGELVTLGLGRDVLHSEPREFGDDGTTKLAIAVVHDSYRGEWRAEYSREADALTLERASDPEEINLFAPGFQYLSADRIVPQTTFPKSHHAVVVRGSLGARGEHTVNFLRVHGSTAVRDARLLHPRATGSTLLEQTNAWLSELSCETSIEVREVLDADLVQIVYRRVGTDIKTEGQRSTNVGFGLTVALPIIVACLAAQPGSVLIVENPEAHLHPKGQVMVGRLCALASAAGAQVVIESHSDHVLNALRLAVKQSIVKAQDVALSYFSRNEGVLEPVIADLTIDNDGMIAAWPPGFFDEMDHALDALLK